MLKKIMNSFYGWVLIDSRLDPLRGGSLLFIIQVTEIPGNHFIELGKKKEWVDLGVTQWFWKWDAWIGNPAP